MPGPKRQSLAAFASWLIEERGVSRVTVNTYCSAVRRVAKLVPDLHDPDALRVAVDGVATSSVPVMLAAWGAFRAFAKVTHGVDLPDIPRAARAVPTSTSTLLDAPAPGLPDTVGEIVRASGARGWTVETWGALRWDHAETVAIVRGEEHLVFRAPADKVGVSLPAPEARRLLEWGWPAASDVQEVPPGGPLLPRQPGAMDPFPAWRLRAYLRS